MHNIDKPFSEEYPDIDTIELEPNEAAGTLDWLTDKEHKTLTLRNFRVGTPDSTPRSIVLDRMAERDIEGVFGDIDSRIGKPIVVRTDRGATYGGIWVAKMMIAPDWLA